MLLSSATSPAANFPCVGVGINPQGHRRQLQKPSTATLPNLVQKIATVCTARSAALLSISRGSVTVSAVNGGFKGDASAPDRAKDKEDSSAETLGASMTEMVLKPVLDAFLRAVLRAVLRAAWKRIFNSKSNKNTAIPSS